MPVARLRTVTVEVWMPELPPMAMIAGTNSTSGLNVASTPENRSSTPPDSSVPSRQNRSHGSRCRMTPQTLRSSISSELVAAIFRLSSVASSWMTSTMSSTVT